MRRVVITGMAAISPLGNNWTTISTNLQARQNKIKYLPEWEIYQDLNTKLAAPVLDFVIPDHFTRKIRRSMGRVALMSCVAAENALAQAGLSNDSFVQSGEMGIAFGSSAGSTEAVKELGSMLSSYSMREVNATTYIRMMSHTTAVNMGVYLGVKGRIIPTSSACTSGSQGIGFAYETIKYGQQTAMLAGGAEALCVSQAAVFDTLYATSQQNNNPELSPRPFDRNRDGLVIGEGAGVLVLEEYEHAKSRGAEIIAEIIGFACNSDGSHITQPTAQTMQIAMQTALKSAELNPSDIDYINAHGTATEQGDIAESHATNKTFGYKTPISSLKSYMGHTLGACGALEAIISINMMQESWLAPTINLQHIDPRCAPLDYIVNDIRSLPLTASTIMTNNFAFGGINTSLIIKSVT